MGIDQIRHAIAGHQAIAGRELHPRLPFGRRIALDRSMLVSDGLDEVMVSPSISMGLREE